MNVSTLCNQMSLIYKRKQIGVINRSSLKIMPMRQDLLLKIEETIIEIELRKLQQNKT